MLELERFISLRYFKSSRKERFMSAITVIATTGVSLGVTTLIITSSIMNGFERDLRNALIGANAHLTISTLIDVPASEAFGADTIKKIVEEPNVIRHSPFILKQAILIGKDNKTSGSLVKGIQVPLEMDNLDLVRSFKKNILSSKHPAYVNESAATQLINGQEILKQLQYQHNYKPNTSTPNQRLDGIILGATLAKNLSVTVGDTVILIPPEGKISPFGSVPRPKKLLVLGMYKSGLSGYDEVLSFLNMKIAQAIFKKDDKYTAVSVYLKDPYQAEKMGSQLSQKLDFPYIVSTWIEDNANLFAVLLVEKYALTIVLFIIILVAAFNIVSSLIMLVHEKRRDIAILKVMGTTDKSILRIFMMQGLIIGIIGSISGFLIGISICWLLKNYNFIDIPAGVYVNDRLPLYIEWWQVFAFVSASMIICFLVTLIPAKKAAKTKPSNILRYE